jgi:hypothetical protein
VASLLFTNLLLGAKHIGGYGAVIAVTLQKAKPGTPLLSPDREAADRFVPRSSAPKVVFLPHSPDKPQKPVTLQLDLDRRW